MFVRFYDNLRWNFDEMNDLLAFSYMFVTLMNGFLSWALVIGIYNNVIGNDHCMYAKVITSVPLRAPVVSLSLSHIVSMLTFILLNSYNV